jgi:hypothetical protein
MRPDLSGARRIFLNAQIKRPTQLKLTSGSFCSFTGMSVFTTCPDQLDAVMVSETAITSRALVALQYLFMMASKKALMTSVSELN